MEIKLINYAYIYSGTLYRSHFSKIYYSFSVLFCRCS